MTKFSANQIVSCTYSENFLQGNPSTYQSMIISNNSTQRYIEIDTSTARLSQSPSLLTSGSGVYGTASR